MSDKKVSFTILGDPVAKARVRMRWGATKHAWNCQAKEQIDVKTLIIDAFEKTIGQYPCEETYFTGPCGMRLLFYIRIRKTHRVPEGSYHYYTPDIDNLEKWFLDCASNIIYRSDCIISHMESEKLYSDKPRTEVTIWQL